MPSPRMRASCPVTRKMQADGASLLEIAAHLDDEGRVTRNGAAWGSVQVLRALRRA